MENCTVYNKWNPLTHRYDPYYVPADKKLVFYGTDLEAIVNCCQCLKEIKYGDSYVSLEVHTNIGMGYAVCKDCYEQEWVRRTNLQEAASKELNNLEDNIMKGEEENE